MSNLVQFIAGLGPRKGTALLKFMRQSKDKGRLENRTQLVQQCRMGPIEVINSSGFIKINTGKYYFTKKKLFQFSRKKEINFQRPLVIPKFMLRPWTVLEFIMKPMNGLKKWQLTL